MADEELVDIEIPDELPDNAVTTYVAVVKKAGFMLPPKRKRDKIVATGGTPRAELCIHLHPLSIKYDSNPAMFEDNDVHLSYPVYNRNGALNGKGSKIDRFKRAAKALGFSITNNAEAARLEGKIFRVESQEVKWDNWQRASTTGAEDAPISRKPDYMDVFVEQVDSYAHAGEVPTYQRPRSWRTVSAAQVFDSSEIEAAMPALATLLHGKRRTEWETAIIDSGDPAVLREPFLTEVTTDLDAFAARMTNGGKMRLVSDMLIKA